MKEWKVIQSEQDFHTLLERSDTVTQIIFKDSTTCGISAHARHRLEEGYEAIGAMADFNYLDLLSFRSISNLIATELGVTHQSPQIIVIRNRKAIYTSSHHAINPSDIAGHL